MSASHSTNLATNGSKNQTELYIHEIPLEQRRELCGILDELNIWSDLAMVQMGYTKTDLQDIKRSAHLGRSPADELLTMWGEQNHTVTELFILLYRMQQYTAMDTIRNLVNKKYHRLILTGQPDLSNLLSNLAVDNKNLNDTNQKKSKLKQLENVQFASNSNNDDVEYSSYSNKNSKESLNVKNLNEYASMIPQISYLELVEATDNWNEKNILGKGGFGTVYKGVWKYTSVAIKRIEYKGSGSAEVNKVQIQQSLNELKYLNSCRHDNILPLYGYSINGEEPCLIYQLMTGGSLEQRLGSNKRTPLTWKERINIARGTARGLQFLHTFKEKPLIHGDIKPANILLDPCTQPKIGDFGLAREGPNALNSSMEVSRVYGTKPYLPVEFLGYKTLSTKVDTYSFGVVLLELVTGLRAYDKYRQHKFLTKHILSMCTENAPIENLMDKSLPIDVNAAKTCINLVSLAKMCIAEKPEQRPEMVTVLWYLEDELHTIYLQS